MRICLAMSMYFYVSSTITGRQGLKLISTLGRKGSKEGLDLRFSTKLPLVIDLINLMLGTRVLEDPYTQARPTKVGEVIYTGCGRF